MPRGFTQYNKKGQAKVLRLKHCLYGFKQSPRELWKYLMEKLESCNLKQSDFDPCLLIESKVILVVYVDDILMRSSDKKHIYDFGRKLCEQGVDLEGEDDAAGFLGVKLTKFGISG